MRTALLVAGGFIALFAACSSSPDASEAGSRDGTPADAALGDGAARDVEGSESGPWPSEDAAISDAAGDAAPGAMTVDGRACDPQTAGPLPAGAARSAGFSGGDDAYFALYSVTCQTASECGTSCTSAGGTLSSCTAGSACVTEGDGSSDCLPPTYWTGASGALSRSGTTTNAAELILVQNPYEDALVVTGFGLGIPSNATVSGISFVVHRNADDGFAVDGSVRVLRDGVPTGTDEKATGAWPMLLAGATYGGTSDTWGTSFSPADVNAAGFGISVTPHYTGPANGNDRAHVDAVTVTVTYEMPCE